MNKKIVSLGYLLIFVMAAVACGLVSQVQIRGQVWQDENNDGLKGQDEPGLAGVSVSLFKVEDGTTVEAGSKLTNENGEYQFDIDQSDSANLEIRVTAPEGAQFTKQHEGTGDEVDSDVDAGGLSGFFTILNSEAKIVVDAGLVSAVQVASTSTETGSDTGQPAATPSKIAEPTIAPISTPVEATATSIAPPLTTTLAITSPAEVADSGVLSQIIPDGLDDAVDCEKTLALTGQDLPFDIAEVGWVIVDDEVNFFLQFDESVESLLEDVGGEDFLGLGWGIFDTKAEVFSESDPTWLANVSTNNSFDVIYDPDSGDFFSTLFIVQDGSWTEAPGVEYPVMAAGNYITMTVPITHVPNNASGFGTAVYFNAEEGQLACDWAGIDETAYQSVVEELTTSSAVIDPNKLAPAYVFKLPEFEPVPGGGDIILPPSLDGAYVVTNTVTSGQVHELFVNLEPVIHLTITHGMIATDSLQFLGNGAWVDVVGELMDDGNFVATGSGIVAGFTGIDVVLAGTITEEGLDAEYTMGDSGGLPGEVPIVYIIKGQKLFEVPIESHEVYSETITTFYAGFNDAFQTQNIDYLFEKLHPTVIDLYGAPGCQDYLTSVIGNPVSVQVLDISGPSPWLWERDEQTIPVDDVFTIEANVSVAGQTQVQEMHVAAIDDDIYWFTDCGEPLP